MTEQRTVPCKACGRPVVWVRPGPDGDLFTIDPKPSPDGDLTTTGYQLAGGQHGYVPEVRVEPVPLFPDGRRRYVRHELTCRPQAAAVARGPVAPHRRSVAR